MSNPTVVERMADAIAAARSNTDKALAALEALRVPSEGMKRAGVDADDKRTGNETCAHIYEAMISAAISEHKGK